MAMSKEARRRKKEAHEAKQAKQFWMVVIGITVFVLILLYFFVLR